MEVLFHNLGPISEARVDLSKRLIVVTGPNNSGKTYLSWSVYGLLSQNHSPRFAKSSAAWELAARLVDAGEQGIGPEEAASYARASIEEMAANLQNDLPTFFAVREELFKETSVRLVIPSSELLDVGVSDLFLGSAGHSLRTARGNGRASVRVSYGKDDRTYLFDHDHVAATALTSEQRARAVGALARSLALFATPEHIPFATLFPAERIAVNVFARELALRRTELVDRVLDAPEQAREIVERGAKRYPRPIALSIARANDMSRLRQLESKLHFLADDLEAILGGSVRISEDGELTFTPGGTHAPTLPFHVTSSLVKSLAGIVFHLRHLAQQDELLIIDEPELNLHPDLQREVARFLARAVRNGLRLMISTHSDYVVRELSNLVRLGEAGEPGKRLAAERGYDPESLLRADEVDVLYLRDGRAEHLQVDAKGFSVPSIDDAIDSQNRDTDMIEFDLPGEG